MASAVVVTVSSPFALEDVGSTPTATIMDREWLENMRGVSSHHKRGTKERILSKSFPVPGLLSDYECREVRQFIEAIFEAKDHNRTILREEYGHWLAENGFGGHAQYVFSLRKMDRF